ncbi:alpha-tectorin-like, partial [Saccoglossus kowalevskii]
FLGTKWVQVFTATWPCGDNRKTIYVNFVLEKAYDTDTKIHVSLKDGNTVVIGPLVITIPAGQTSKQITFTAPADKIYTVWYGLVKDGSKKREVQYIQTDQQDVSPPECTTIPPPTPKPTGITEQDPHMTTFDGVRYNFQGLCTYVLTQDCSNINKPSFQVTAEFRGKYSELRSKPLTRINAVDVNVDGMQLLRILKNDNFLIKGQLFTNSTAVIGNGLGTVKVEDEHVYVQLNNPALSLVWTKPTHGINIALNGPNMRGNVCGLLGNANGDPEDDFMKSDGVIVTKDDIYEFGDSWMVPGSCE